MRAALYARFSTELQSDRSIPDQLRVCDRLAAQHNFTVVARFSDAAISGGTARRPGYQDMIEAARKGRFEIILAEDCTRLWRNLAEQAPRLAELADLGVEVVTQDLDTRQESAGILAAVLGASGEAYRREIGRRTRRGLEGRARERKPTGGKAYGYAQGQIVPAQAAVVREIFERFAAGESQRAIAMDLNARGIPAPGATWNRKQRAADGKWRVSALHAILRNERYIGQVIWNRSRWVRSRADSSKRKRIENPRSDWIVHEGPAVIDRRTWDRVQARGQTGFASPKARPRYLLSGLLECGVCGAKLTITGGKAHRYVCGNRHTGPGCKNDLGVPRTLAEKLILEPVRTKLLRPEFIEYGKRYARSLTMPAPKADPRLAELKRLVSTGVLSAEEAEPAMRRLRQTARTPEPDAFLAADAYLTAMEDLQTALDVDDVAAARPLLREIIGPITTLPTEQDGERYLTAHFPEFGGVAAMVAGAGFEPATFGL